MGTIKARYDAAAERYLTWWGPVLAPTATRLLDRYSPEARDGAGPRDPRPRDRDRAPGDRRRPSLGAARVVGLDASTGMLGVAAAPADAQLATGERDRLELVSGDAGRLPFPDASFDLVLSSFVLQLVADRSTALREAWRVLRPGGHLATVTWLVGREDDRFAPDDAFEEALDELDIADEGDAEEARSGDFRLPLRPPTSSAGPASARSAPKASSSSTPTTPPPTWGSSRSTPSARCSRTSSPTCERRLHERAAARLVRLDPTPSSGARRSSRRPGDVLIRRPSALDACRSVP